MHGHRNLKWQVVMCFDQYFMCPIRISNDVFIPTVSLYPSEQTRTQQNYVVSFVGLFTEQLRIYDICVARNKNCLYVMLSSRFSLVLASEG